MNRIVASFLFAAFGAGAFAADVAPPPRSKTDPAVVLAAAIDRHLAHDWAVKGVVPAAPADDAEFLRRVYLDLTGRTPKVPDVRAFLDDPSPDKRAKLVETLLASPQHAKHFAALARAEWFPNAGNNFRIGFELPTLEDWLAER